MAKSDAWAVAKLAERSPSGTCHRTSSRPVADLVPAPLLPGRGAASAARIESRATSIERSGSAAANTRLARLRAGDGKVGQESRQLIAAFDALTRELCAEVRRGGVGADRECPPGDAALPALADHALGDQLSVMADQLERAAGLVRLGDAQSCGHERLIAQAQTLAAACLALRRSTALSLG